MDPWKGAQATVSSFFYSFWFCCYSLGDLLAAILVLTSLDLVLGLFCAIKNKSENKSIVVDEDRPPPSGISAERFYRKINQLILFFIALAALLCAAPAFEALGRLPTAGATYLCVLYVIYELLSIMEILGKLGFQLAKNILKYLGHKK